MFCVVYRTGGTENFQWKRTNAYATEFEANSVQESIEEMGYKAMVVPYGISTQRGLPDTYESASGLK